MFFRVCEVTKPRTKMILLEKRNSRLFIFMRMSIDVRKINNRVYINRHESLLSFVSQLRRELPLLTRPFSA
jgi:hypothetical protein